MILDFLFRKIECYYCKKKIRRRDAVEMILVIKKKIIERNMICPSCAEVVKGISEATKRFETLAEKRKKHD